MASGDKHTIGVGHISAVRASAAAGLVQFGKVLSLPRTEAAKLDHAIHKLLGVDEAEVATRKNAIKTVVGLYDVFSTFPWIDRTSSGTRTPPTSS